MSSNQLKESTILPVVLSVGIFLATTALSQWVNQDSRKSRLLDDRKSLYDDDEDDEEADEQAYQELKGWYHSRRLHDRLSYENLSKAVDSVQQKALDDDQTESDLHSESSLDRDSGHPSKTRMIPSSDPSNSLTGLPPHPNAESDFHPKNRNWQHFEHFNEEDKKAQLIDSKNQHSYYEMDEQFLAEDGAKCISSQGSASSEEQFVWTMHQHRQSQQAEEKRWSEGIQNKMSNGLTSPFNPSPIPERFQEGQVSVEPRPPQSHKKLARSRMRSSSSLSDDKTERIQHKPNRIARRSDDASAAADPRTLMQRFLSFHSESQPPSPVANVIESPPPVISNCSVRALYNARIMPEKLVMIRHGQSMGNIDELLYSTIPDNAMPLTDLGWEQAHMAGKVLKEKVLSEGETVHFIVSPYVRTVETFHGLVSAWCDPKEFSHIEDRKQRIKAWYSRLIEMGISWNEDSRIREQDFGNYQVRSV